MSGVALSRPRGRLLVVEGLDGVGKTTFSRMLADRLGVRWTTTPDQCVRQVRHVIDDVWAQTVGARRLFYAASVLAISSKWRNRADPDDAWVVDRYWLSTLAYADVEGSTDVLASLGRFVAPADVTFFLEAPREVRRARLATRASSACDRVSIERSRDLEASYERALQDPSAGRVHRLDARGDVDDLLEEALSVLDESSVLSARHRRADSSPVIGTPGIEPGTPTVSR